MAKVLVFGSINMDLVTYVDALPLKGETVTGAKFQSFPGGKGANQAVAATRAGAHVEMYGCVGDDSIGQECLHNLQFEGIDTHAVLVKYEEHSGIAQIMVDTRGENIIAVAPRANFLFNPDDIAITERNINEGVIALFQNEIPQPTTEAMIQSCRRLGIPVVWNTAPACKNRPSRKTMKAVDYLICNRGELKTLIGVEGDDETLAINLREWGVRNVIVTLGEEGALLVSEEDVWCLAAFPVNPVDTVGAGDCFCGVFACSLALKSSVKKALRRASAAAALSIAARGAQTSMPTAGQIEEFLLQVN